MAALRTLLEAGEGRTRFLAVCGLMSALGFAAAILFNTIAVLTVPPCVGDPAALAGAMLLAVAGCDKAKVANAFGGNVERGAGLIAQDGCGTLPQRPGRRRRARPGRPLAGSYRDADDPGRHAAEHARQHAHLDQDAAGGPPRRHHAEHGVERS